MRTAAQYTAGAAAYVGCGALALFAFTFALAGWMVLGIRMFEWLMRITE